MYVHGLEFTSDTIQQIRQSLKETPSISRRALARNICELMDWKAESGRFKETVCRKALMVLEDQNLLDLPKPGMSHGFKKVIKTRQNPPWVQPINVDCDLNGLGCIDIEMVTSRYSKAFKTWKGLMDTYHYLGSGPLCGAQIRYLVRSSFYGYIGAVSFSSSAWALKDRDKFIGWTKAAQRSNLQRIVSNSRFLILPTVRIQNLASHVLSRCAARIAVDWTQRYGIEPVLLETFVDPKRFSGTCYRAANWTRVGCTSGRRRAQCKKGGGPKDIFLYPLRQDWQEILRAEPRINLGQRPRAADPVDWVEKEFGTVEFYDPRLKKRLLNIVRDFYGQPQASIPQACGLHAKTKAAYRFFSNERVNMDEVIRGHVESTVERIKAHDIVLAVQDTTSLNYTTHPAMQGLGPINTTQNSSVGLMLHDTMAFTPQGTPLGLLDVQCWARDTGDRGKRYRRKRLPIEQKESMKWLKSYRAVHEVQNICPQTMLISVGDRESDIYELFLESVKNPNGPKLLVRCERSRKRKTETDFLWEEMGRQPIAGIQVVHVPRKGSRAARDAKLQVRYAQVKLKSPYGKGYPPIAVWMVYAQEADYPKEIKSPLEWMLLTTVDVHTFTQACERLAWYARRWGIEVYHRTLKSGCRIEDRRLETAESLESCLAIDMVVAWRIFHLTKLGREVPNSPCTIFFKEGEWKALHVFINKTPDIPSKEPTLFEAVRMVASLGGFLNRKGDGYPGTMVLWRGLQRLEDITATYLMLRPHLKSGP